MFLIYSVALRDHVFNVKFSGDRPCGSRNTTAKIAYATL